MEEAYKTNLMEELKNLGVLNRKVASTVELLQEILSRLSLEVLLKPADLFTIRTLQETTLVKKFLAEFEVMPPAVQENASVLNERGKLLFAFGDFSKAAQDFTKAAGRTREPKKKGIARFNQFLSLLQRETPEEIISYYLEAVQLAPEVCEFFDSSRYTPEKMLEIGIWGIGFLCRRENAGHCVVKCPMQKDLNVEELSQKLSTLRDLNSPYIAKLQEIGHVPRNDKPYIVMEYANGISLKDYMEGRDEIPEEKAIPFLKKMARALSQAHDKDILHSDIKPRNILVIEEEEKLQPVLINFGLNIQREKLKEYQIALGKKESSELTAGAQDVLESLEYGSPELNGEYVEGKLFNIERYSDVYAFGKVASYVLFKTTRPYAQHWQKLLSPELHEVIEKCLMENPKNRYQNLLTVLSHMSAYKFAQEHYSSEDYERALTYFQRAVEEEGHPLACYALSIMYTGGEGVPVREGRAEKYRMMALSRPDVEKEARNAAEAGDRIAQTLLSDMYRFGICVAQNHEEAATWLKKAAESKYPAAQTILGHMYQAGTGVPQNYPEAAKWYQKAAEKGYAPAQYAMGYIHLHGLGVAQDFGAAITWYHRAADKGYAAADIALGHMFRNGPGVARDYQEAVLWFSTGLPQDYREAVQRYEKAARKGHPVAQTNLACMYLYGLGVPQDIMTAVQWFQKAAARGYHVAHYCLGYLHRCGLGVPQDNQMAYRCFTKATEKGDEETKKGFQRLLKKGK